MASRKRLRYLLAFFILAGGLYYFGRSPAPGFSYSQVSSTLAPQAEWAIPAPSSEEKEQLQQLFSRPFKFLGEGAQAFAFESSDGKYVLKFFKMRRFTPSWQDHLCPHVVKRRLKNLKWVFNGYKIGYDEFRKETGLVFIHLAKTDHLNQKVTLLDEKGREHQIDLDKTEFILQEKAELIFHRLEKLYAQGDVAKAEKAIASVLDLVKLRIAKGYADRDKAVSNNYGFVGDKAIQLDIGRLYQGVPKKGGKERQLLHVKKRIDRWKRENGQG
jgi:hypothetical protein